MYKKSFPEFWESKFRLDFPQCNLCQPDTAIDWLIMYEAMAIGINESKNNPDIHLKDGRINACKILHQQGSIPELRLMVRSLGDIDQTTRVNFFNTMTIGKLRC
jgi:hypothetical protein